MSMRRYVRKIVMSGLVAAAALLGCAGTAFAGTGTPGTAGTVTPAAGLVLRLWSDQTPTVYETGAGRRADLLATGSAAGVLRYRSRSAHGRFLYLEVAFAGNPRAADRYTLRVSAPHP